MKQAYKPLFLFTVIGMSCFYSCDEKPAPDPCCVFSELPATSGIGSNEGMLQVEGKTSAYFYVFDASGKKVNYQTLNKSLALNPGKYQIRVNNSTHDVEIKSGILAKCSTATLLVTGKTNEYYYVMDSLSEQLSYDVLGKAVTLFPSLVKVKVNNTELPVEVKVNQTTEVKTGTLIVRGTTGEYYYVLDAMNKQLNYNTLEKPLAFLPGAYKIKMNKTSLEAEVKAEKITELATGSILVNGSTNEYYYVSDTLGNALNHQNLNEPLSFFPGNVQIKLNNTLMNARVIKGETIELQTGSIVLTGSGTGYYYVLDLTGNSLNHNTMNKSLSFFPSEYVVKLGENTGKAIVSPGKLTSISSLK
ncbi:MAG: hypothetical protein ABIR06_17425 [Cyclobacteriaceae bacterium]